MVAEDKRLAEDVRLANRSAADAQSKLVQDIMSRQAEQEAANKTVSEPVVDEKADDNKGGGIRLRMRKPGTIVRMSQSYPFVYLLKFCFT